MSRRYWLPIIAVVGLILSAQHHAQAQGSQSSATQAQAAPKQQPQPAVPPALQNSLDRIGTALEAANNKQTSKEETDRAKQDLAAQLVMARAADRMFYVGLAETIITFIGVMLVLATLIYTRKAADAARDAVNEAREATRTTKSLQMPLIRAEVGELYEQHPGGSGRRNNSVVGEKPAIADFKFLNEGRGDAYPKRFSYGFLICKTLPFDPIYTKTVTYPHGTTAKQGEQFNPQRGWFLLSATNEEREAIGKGNAELRFYVKLVYTDFSGDLHEYSECWSHHGFGEGAKHFRFVIDERAPRPYGRKS